MDTEIDKIIAILGSQSKLAKALNVSNNAVSKWVAQGYVPPGRVIAISELVKNKTTPNGDKVTLTSLLKESTDRSKQRHGLKNG